ncbi:MAG: hypothetical protein Q4A66_03475 [Eubacteriales bacterium]|nr:hypothetical protein [Eubacteriales bacterium]
MKLRRILCLMLLACLLTAAAHAGSDEYRGTLPEEMFLNAKQALSLMSYGEYEAALETLGLDPAQAGDFRFFAEASFTSLFDGVQLEVAVACLTDDYGWILAIPLWEPDAIDVETFLLHSSDGQTFDGYTSATWEFVDELLPKSKDTIWYDRYEPGDKFVVAD